MKTFFFASIIGIVLIVGGVVFDNCIDDFSEKMLIGCEELEDSIPGSDAKKTVEEIGKYLEDRKILLESIINHDSIDEIEACMTEIKGYLDNDDSEEARVKCEKLKLLLAKLPMKYRLSVHNIL